MFQKKESAGVTPQVDTPKEHLHGKDSKFQIDMGLSEGVSVVAARPTPLTLTAASPETPEVNDHLLFTKVRKRVQIKGETKRL